MSVITKCSAEVSFIQHDFISFDFGDFAVVIGYDQKKKKNLQQVHAYFNDDYQQKFMTCWCPKIGCFTDFIEVPFKAFNLIRDTALLWREKGDLADCNELFALLKKHFFKQMKLYGC